MTQTDVSRTQTDVSRRHFIKTAAAVAAAPAFLPKVLQAQDEPGPGAPAILDDDADKLRIACIGVGGRGHSGTV